MVNYQKVKSHLQVSLDVVVVHVIMLLMNP